MKQRWILMALALAVASPATAGKVGKQVRYAGVHPVPKGDGGGMCHIEGPHVHVYPVSAKLEYRTVGDANVFVGDPMAYGWDGEKHAYKGHHPVQVNVVADLPEPSTHYCYITGPHYHSFEPNGPDFQVVGDAYFYVGTPAPLYLQARPQYIGVNAVYQPIAYERPVIEVVPPSAWIMVQPAFVIETPAAVVVEPPRGRANVGVGVGVSVQVPTISVGVQVGGPAVIVAPGRGHGKSKHKKSKRH